MSRHDAPRRTQKPPTVGPSTARKPGHGRSEDMADPDIHDGAARPSGGPEPLQRPDDSRGVV